MEELQAAVEAYVTENIGPKVDDVPSSVLFFDQLVAWMKENGVVEKGPLVTGFTTFDPAGIGPARSNYDLFIGWMKMVGAIPGDLVTTAGGIIAEDEQIVEIHLRIPFPRRLLEMPEFAGVLKHWAISDETAEIETKFDSPLAK